VCSRKTRIIVPKHCFMWDEYTLGTTALSLAFLNNKNSHFEKTDDVEIMWNLINVI